MLRSTIMARMSEAVTDSKFRFMQLQELESRISWQGLVDLIEPDFLESNIGNNLISVETLIRIYFLQLRYGMNPSSIEEALFQIEVLRDFALIDMEKGVIPSETCIRRFNKLINENNLESKIIKAFDLDAT